MEVDLIMKINGGGDAASKSHYRTTVTLWLQINKKNKHLYLAHVKSFLVTGSSQIARGHSTLSTLLRADIAVDNGVVHLVDRPLAVTASKYEKQRSIT